MCDECVYCTGGRVQVAGGTGGVVAASSSHHISITSNFHAWSHNGRYPVPEIPVRFRVPDLPIPRRPAFPPKPEGNATDESRLLTSDSAEDRRSGSRRAPWILPPISSPASQAAPEPTQQPTEAEIRSYARKAEKEARAALAAAQEHAGSAEENSSHNVPALARQLSDPGSQSQPSSPPHSTDPVLPCSRSEARLARSVSHAGLSRAERRAERDVRRSGAASLAPLGSAPGLGLPPTTHRAPPRIGSRAKLEPIAPRASADPSTDRKQGV